MSLPIFLAIASFLQPYGLPGCDFFPRPSCAAPDIEELEWRDEDRRYVWPPEANNPPFDRITRHNNPGLYGPNPFPAPDSHSLCIVDEPTNSVDCYSYWEVVAIAYCQTSRWKWVGRLPDGRFSYEHPVNYWEYRSPMRVLFWEWKDKPRSFPSVYAPQPSPHTPPHTFGVHIDRIQNIRQSNFIGSATIGRYLIREKDTTPLFRDVFEWFPGSGGNRFYGGGTGFAPLTDTEPSACVSQAVVGNFCGMNPNRPECLPNN